MFNKQPKYLVINNRKKSPQITENFQIVWFNQIKGVLLHAKFKGYGRI